MNSEWDNWLFSVTWGCISSRLLLVLMIEKHILDPELYTFMVSWWLNVRDGHRTLCHTAMSRQRSRYASHLAGLWGSTARTTVGLWPVYSETWLRTSGWHFSPGWHTVHLSSGHCFSSHPSLTSYIAWAVMNTQLWNLNWLIILQLIQFMLFYGAELWAKLF